MFLIGLLALALYGLLPFTLWALAMRWGAKQLRQPSLRTHQVGAWVMVAATVAFGSYAYWASGQRF